MALLGALASRAAAQAAHDGGSTRPDSTVDASVRPGDDFFAYANGGWLKATAIPAGKDRWSARDEITERARGRVAQLLRDARTAPIGSPARKVAAFRAALLNDAAIEARGLASLQPYLDSVQALRDKAGLTRLLGRGMRADVDPLAWGVYRSSTLLGLSVEPGVHGEKTYVAFLLQGGLGLPDRDDYVSGEPRMVAERARYRAYVARLLALAGFESADQRADAVMALETAVARTQATREASASDHNADTVWTRRDFARLAPGMSWTAFFAAAGLARQDAFVPWQPGAMRGAAALVASQPLEAWKDYLRVRALDTYADVLPGAFARAAAAFREAASPDTPPVSRERRADEMTQLAMSDAIGSMYADRWFSAAQKTRVRGIVANVVAAFADRVKGVTWMSPATKAVALDKLKTLYVGVGYPDHGPDCADLEVDSADAVGNLRRVADWNYRHAVALLGTPVDRSQWWIAPQTAGAVLVFQQNAYDFSAALLQSPKFDSTASDAAAYGSIGAIIGHDVTHFVDVLGAEYDTDGRTRHWWSAEDMPRFEEAAEPLVQQYSAYRPLPDVALDGKLALTENVADLGGLAAAFDAWRRTLGGRAADTAYVRRSDREFFIAFARSWRTRLTDTAMRAQAAAGDHAPDAWRVATVRNLDAWYDAFDVRPGDRLYLAPGARVHIW